MSFKKWFIFSSLHPAGFILWCLLAEAMLHFFFQVPFWKSYYTLEILLRLVLFSCQKNQKTFIFYNVITMWILYPAMLSLVAVTLFINQFHCPVGRYAARGSVCSCCGCRLWGTTVLKSSSLFLPVWYQDFLLCPPLEGPVPSTPSFITLSPRPLMVDIIAFLKTYNMVTKVILNILNWNGGPFVSVWADRVVPEEIAPLVPAVAGDKVADDQTCYILETLLKYMVIQVRTSYAAFWSVFLLWLQPDDTD